MWQHHLAQPGPVEIPNDPRSGLGWVGIDITEIQFGDVYANIGPDLTKLGASWPDLARHRPILSELAQMSTGFGPDLLVAIPNLVEIGPNLARPAQKSAEPAQIVGRHRPKFWSNPAQLWPNRPKLGQPPDQICATRASAMSGVS